MLIELQIRGIGVIDELRLPLGPGMTAVTGETGAGKTMIVGAIELLVGGRADPVLVRPGVQEAWVEGRFADLDLARGADGDDVVLARAIPASGRSRAYVNGRLAPASVLAEEGSRLVDLYGQHAHQSLLSAPVQRAALDAFAAIEVAPLEAARARVKDIDAALAALGGDARARAREIDLLRFQVSELDAAQLSDPDEDAALEAEEDRLAGVVAHREAAAAAHAGLNDDDGVRDGLASAVAAIAGRAPFADLEARLRAAAAEVDDVAAELRDRGEALDEDPERLAAVRSRRQLLRDLRRKYGETISEVMAYWAEAEHRLSALEGHDARAAALDAERADALRVVTAAEAAVGRARRAAAPRLAQAVEAHLRQLAMPRARLEVLVGEADPGDHVTFLLGANPGEPALPLSKVASGGELARAMLACRLVLTAAPPTLVFDEVDAGIGGEAAVAVGRALAQLAADRQVLVVTHLPQVAAFADQQIAVTKQEILGRTVATAAALDPDARIIELSRMLSGQPDSGAAQSNARELLDAAARQRGR